PLHPVKVHGDVGHVAGEAHPRAVGRDVDALGDVGAVELQGVLAVLALDDVAAVAGVPHERVVPRPQERHVVAAAAGHQVVAVAPEEGVGAGAADDGVVAGPAVHRQPDHAGGQGGGAHHVVAAERVHHEGVVRPLGALDVHGRLQPGHAETGPAAGHLDGIGV